MLEKKTPFHRLPTAQKCCKKQYKIKIFVWGDEKVHSCPQANQNTKFAKQNQKKTKITPGNRCPQLRNPIKNNRKSWFSCCMTKTWPKITPTRKMLITIMGLQKHLKMTKKTHFQKLLTEQKCVENNIESTFSCWMIKKCTHAPNANPHKLVEKTIEKRSHDGWGPKC